MKSLSWLSIWFMIGRPPVSADCALEQLLSLTGDLLNRSVAGKTFRELLIEWILSPDDLAD